LEIRTPLKETELRPVGDLAVTAGLRDAQKTTRETFEIVEQSSVCAWCLTPGSQWAKAVTKLSY